MLKDKTCFVRTLQPYGFSAILLMHAVVAAYVHTSLGCTGRLSKYSRIYAEFYRNIHIACKFQARMTLIDPLDHLPCIC